MKPIPNQLLTSLSSVKNFDEEAFLKAHNPDCHTTSIRINPWKVTELQDDFKTHPIAWSLWGRYLDKRPSFSQDPIWHAGGYYVQEASSQFLWHLLQQVCPPSQPYKVLDLCAAPGGKSTLLASFFQEGIVVANEIIKTRVTILEENIAKWGHSHTIVTNNDPIHFKKLHQFFDIVVVDAPCSGSGMFRKDPNAIEEWGLEHVHHCQKRQQRILSDIYDSIHQNGILIYATCSYSTEENEAIVDWLLQHFELESLPIHTPTAWQITETLSNKHKGYGYRFFPHLVQGEGFFVACFRKKGTHNNFYTIGKKLCLANKNEYNSLLPWLTDEAIQKHSIIKHKDNLLAFPTAFTADFATLQKHLYIKQAGIKIGINKNKGLVPSHHLAVSLLINNTIPSIEIDKPTALSYLRKEPFDLDNTNKGWTLLRYQSLALGWIKNLGNRINNYYPTEWRLLK